MKITLDRPAMQALIDRDPDFELSLQKAVLSEIGRRVLSKDASKIIAQAEPELFAKCLRGLQEDENISRMVRDALDKILVKRIQPSPGTWNSGRTVISDEARNLIDGYVAKAKENALALAQASFEAAFNDLMRERVQKIVTQENIEALVDRRVNSMMTREIDRLVDERFKARMADLRSMMA